MPYKDPIVRREYSQKYRQENKEYFQKYRQEKDYCKEKPWVRMTMRAKKRKNLPFNITAEYVKSIWPEDNKCPALGIEFKRGVGKSIDSSPTLDRIDNSKGYIKGNVQIVCNLANKIMSSATPEQVIQVGKHFKKVMEKKNAA